MIIAAVIFSNCESCFSIFLWVKVQILFTQCLSTCLYTELHLPLSYVLRAQAILRSSVRRETIHISLVVISLEREHTLNAHCLVALLLCYKIKRSTQGEHLRV